MSNLNQDTQPKMPLGSGAKAGARSENRILYVLLFVLIGVFFWKVSSDDDGTKTISQNNLIVSSIAYEEVLSTTNPNVDVEIMDADLLEMKKDISSKQKNKEGAFGEQGENTNVQKSYNLKEMPITKNNGFENISAYDYNYIFAGNVNVPEGTFAGIDSDGFARLMEKKKTRTLIGGHMAYTESIMPDEFYTKGGSAIQNNNVSSFTRINGEMSSPGNANERGGKYPSTGIPYGTEDYPLDDTLDWHPYESLAYLREQKKVYVAEKVRAMPTARDLEPYIPPSTLGDRDTRMGYGVVIRPRR